MPANIIEISAILMFIISFYGLISTKNIIKSIIFIVLMEVSVVMFWLSFGFSLGQLPPILSSIGGMEYIDVVGIENIADPFPQALMITAIIIGLSITAVNTIMFITLYRKYNTIDWDVAKERSLTE
ncbi:MAG: cation:proton antiporter subunit C [Defluviitaleaceae bacterium]|nr:cation:proton antiporter subunit C [Defluviitaleaceae bacterium]